MPNLIRIDGNQKRGGERDGLFIRVHARRAPRFENFARQTIQQRHAQDPPERGKKTRREFAVARQRNPAAQREIQ
jgi:hypothetical protein